jgi:oxygen-independent coproporphyrinogen-3 oxidase
VAPVAVYVHIPFCPTKCGYCDFNSYAMSGEIMERTTRAIVTEIERSPWRGIPAKTIFFGGGTPTYLPAPHLLEIFRAVAEAHPPEEGAEITSEANPGTVDAEKFAVMRAAGFNRISLGAQSFLDEDLITLGRVHRSGHIEKAVSAARAADFENVNVDLMFALPEQSPRAWKDNLRRALELKTEHLSLYCLTIEPNTPFYKERQRGLLVLPEEDAQVEMYEMSVEETAKAGLEQYEISNFAKTGRECAHNLCYWRNEFYAGYGPGAVGFMPATADEPRRYTNLKHPDRYCAAAEAGSPFYFEEELLTEENVRMERLMLGLRLNEGLAFEPLGLEPGKMDKLVDRGWIEFCGGRLHLTRQGRHFCSEATLELL